MNKFLRIVTLTIIGTIVIEMMFGTIFLWSFFFLDVFEQNLIIDYLKILVPLTYTLPLSLLISVVGSWDAINRRIQDDIQKRNLS